MGKKEGSGREKRWTLRIEGQKERLAFNMKRPRVFQKVTHSDPMTQKRHSWVGTKENRRHVHRKIGTGMLKAA